MSAVEEMVCVVCVAEGHSGDGCDLASTLCKFDLRKGNLFVLSWARVRRVRRESIYSGSKRHSLQAVELSQRSQTIYRFWGKPAMRTQWMADADPHKRG